MKASVVVFPGANCDRDAAVALRAVTGNAPHMVWHGDTDLPKSDLIVLPGGFSYGDYLRSGAMAAHSPIVRAVVEQAKRGEISVFTFNSRSVNQRGELVCEGTWTNFVR
jgi:phosphoribosylformylglycinamidine synthase